MFRLSAAIGLLLAVISGFITWAVAAADPFQTGEFWTNFIALTTTAVVSIGIATGLTIAIADTTGDTQWIMVAHAIALAIAAIIGAAIIHEVFAEAHPVMWLYYGLTWSCYAFALVFYVVSALLSYIVIDD